MSQKDSAVGRFFASTSGRLGVVGVALLLLPAIFAPFIANGRPLLIIAGGRVSMPFLRHFFAPHSSDYEVFVECCFNYLALFLPLGAIVFAFTRRCPALRRWLLAALALLVMLPFVFVRSRMDKRDYRQLAAAPGAVRIFAPLPYSPSEQIGKPYSLPDKRHPLGCDNVGRDVASRLIYGSRTSLAVGIFSTALALVIGASVGIASGYWRGWFDLSVMRVVEILMCFPTFLLLLILMATLGGGGEGGGDGAFQSIVLVIAVLGLTGWIGAAFLARGETLKQCAMPYIQSCEVSGIPTARIMFRHLLPNIAPVLLTWGVFSVAGAIMAENGLSFLGFGVKPPGASWGELLQEAFADPMTYWNLTLFPGAAIFLAVISFNFIGDGINKALSPK